MKKFLFVLSLVILIAGLSTLIIVSNNTQDTEPIRPTSIPKDAVWVGGNDGGNWIKCIKVEDGIFKCHIFTEIEGIQISSDQYRLKNAMEITGLAYSSYDGDIIRFQEGVKLVPIDRDPN